MDRLAVRPPPEPGELFSSWLVRLAAANGAKVHTFTKSVTPRETFWNRDVDRAVSHEALAAFSELCGIREEALFATTLRSYAGILFEQHNMYGTTQWLLPLGMHHRVRSDYGLQYCPMCLRDYGYFRKTWRLAIITLCREHHVELCDRCVRCGGPVLLHRAEQGLRGSFDATMHFRCFNCNHDLRRTRARRTAWNFRGALFQNRIEQALQLGFFVLNDVTIYAHLFFAGVRAIMQKLATGRFARTFREAACRHADLAVFEPQWGVNKPAIEHLSVQDRTRLLTLVADLLTDWPRVFVEVARRARLTASALLNYDLSLPYWYVSVVRERLGAGTYVPNNAEIECAVSALKRRGVPVSKTTVGQLLGNPGWHRKRKLTRRITKALNDGH